MIKKFLFFIFLFLLLTEIFLISQERTAKIFFVNLFEKNVDVRLGEENDFVFKMDGLEQFSSTYIVKTSKSGKFKLYFKKSSDNEYFFWSKDGSTPIMCNVEAGRCYCIMIDYTGLAEYYLLEENLQSGARICFLNGSDSNLSKMEVATNWETNVVAYADDLDVYMITNFVTFKPGNYSLFWQFPEQKAKENYFFYPDKTGNSLEIFNLKSGSYYLFLAFTDARKDYAKILDITPNK